MNDSGNHAVYMECKEYLEKEIEENYANFRLDTAAVLDAVEKKFGEENVRYILANTVQKKGAYDKRLQARNVEWAKAISITSSAAPEGVDRSPYFVIDSVNTGLVDLVVTAFQARHGKGGEKA